MTNHANKQIGLGIEYDAVTGQLINTMDKPRDVPETCYYAVVEERTGKVLIYQDVSTDPEDWIESRESLMTFYQSESKITDIPEFIKRTGSAGVKYIIKPGDRFKLYGELNVYYKFVHLGTVDI